MAAALALGPESLPGGPIAILPVEAAGSLDAGRVVEIRFRGLPEDVGELEVLLEGRNAEGAIALRLTERLDPKRGAYFWTVPNLPVSAATLRIRMNRGGREIEGPASPPFAIAPAPGASVVPLVEREGELWVGADAEDDEPAPVPISAMTPVCRIDPLPSEVPIAPGGFAPALPGRSAASSIERTAIRRAAAAASRIESSRAPLSVPARI